MPDSPVFMYGVGHVPATQATQVHDDSTKTFTLTLTEYVNGAFKNCAFRISLPVISLEDITLSLGPHSLAPPATTASIDGSGPVATPTKHRKYTATGTTPTSKSAASKEHTSPNSTSAMALHSQTLKHSSSNASISPDPADDDIEEVVDNASAKGKGKKIAKQVFVVRVSLRLQPFVFLVDIRAK
ncbi:hypothetical protein B0H14DRAFT_2603096 [Mycena olivaceomarginata]|nr:hypothetical protein B0H14DRAFT_2603096 [Mycena olivaceomarginata]